MIEYWNWLVYYRRWRWSLRFHYSEYFWRRWRWWRWLFYWFGWCYRLGRRRWFDLSSFFLLLIFFLGSLEVKTMNYAKLDNICKFFYIKKIKVFSSFPGILLFDILLNVTFHMREEILINLIISKIKNVLNSLFHFGNIQSVKSLLSNTLNIEYIINCLLNVLPIRL